MKELKINWKVDNSRKQYFNFYENETSEPKPYLSLLKNREDSKYITNLQISYIFWD